MSQVLTHYHALHESMRSRRMRPEVPKGLDMLASRAGMTVRHRKTGPAFLWRQAQRTAEMTPNVRNMSEAALDDHISRVREVFVRGRQDDDAVCRGLAAVREVARRVTGEEPFP